VIKYGISGAKYLGEEIIEANAGTFLASLITEAIKNNLKGLEWAAGFPNGCGATRIIPAHTDLQCQKISLSWMFLKE